MTKESICSYEQASRLKRLGFDWPCWNAYVQSGSIRRQLARRVQADNFNSGMYVSAPTTEVAHRWLRDTMQLAITINPQKDLNGNPGWNYTVFYLTDQASIGWSYEIYSTYEEAMSGALDYAIECAVIQYRKRTLKSK